jgi:hypothetical protein
MFDAVFQIRLVLDHNLNGPVDPDSYYGSPDSGSQNFLHKGGKGNFVSEELLLEASPRVGTFFVAVLQDV